MAYTLDSAETLPQGPDIHPGRPNVKKTLDALIMSTATLKGPTGIAVCVCGPIGLAAEVRDVVRKVDGPSRSAVGGVELHEEYVFVFFFAHRPSWLTFLYFHQSFRLVKAVRCSAFRICSLSVIDFVSV